MNNQWYWKLALGKWSRVVIPREQQSGFWDTENDLSLDIGYMGVFDL